MFVFSGCNKFVVEVYVGYVGWQGCDFEYFGVEDFFEVSEDFVVVIDVEYGW